MMHLYSFFMRYVLLVGWHAVAPRVKHFTLCHLSDSRDSYMQSFLRRVQSLTLVELSRSKSGREHSGKEFEDMHLRQGRRVSWHESLERAAAGKCHDLTNLTPTQILHRPCNTTISASSPTVLFYPNLPSPISRYPEHHSKR